MTGPGQRDGMRRRPDELALVAELGAPGSATTGVPRSPGRELAAMVPDVLRLVRDLLGDPRVPRRAKALALLATAYVAAPLDPLPAVLPGVRHRVDEAVAVLLAVRYLLVTAGYDVVRERWTGSDAGFALLVLLAGIAE